MTDRLPFDDDGERHDNGTRRRACSGGDGWSEAHRTELGYEFYMNDIDVAFGSCTWGKNTGDDLFLEYVPDSPRNKEKAVRKFALVAMFDRKATEEAIDVTGIKVSIAFYLWICRSLTLAQAVPPKFFYVIGGQTPPWTMIEVDIETGELSRERVVLESGRWKELWRALGLMQLREAHAQRHVVEDRAQSDLGATDLEQYGNPY